MLTSNDGRLTPLSKVKSGNLILLAYDRLLPALVLQTSRADRRRMCMLDGKDFAQPAEIEKEAFVLELGAAVARFDVPTPIDARATLTGGELVFLDGAWGVRGRGASGIGGTMTSWLDGSETLYQHGSPGTVAFPVWEIGFLRGSEFVAVASSARQTDRPPAA